MSTLPCRTSDADLRQARYDKLVKAAKIANVMAVEAGIDLRVTGSLSRGETHPWSDLDLVAIMPDEKNKNDRAPFFQIMQAIENSGIMEYDVIPSYTIFEPLKPALLHSAILISAIPPISELPNPDLALTRGSQSLALALEVVRGNMIHSEEAAQRYPDTADDIKESYRDMALSILRTKAELALRRLAVFQDGGRSPWLDGSVNPNDLTELIDRLSIARDDHPTLIPDPAYLLQILTYDYDTTYSQEVFDRLIGFVKEWVDVMRAATPLEDTSGLVASGCRDDLRI